MPPTKLDPENVAYIMLVITILITIYGIFRCITTARIDGYTQIKFYWSRFLYRLTFICHTLFLYQPIISYFFYSKMQKQMQGEAKEFNPLSEPLAQMTITVTIMCLGFSFHDFVNFTQSEKKPVPTPWFFVSPVLALGIYILIYSIQYTQKNDTSGSSKSEENNILLAYTIIFYLMWIGYVFIHVLLFFRIVFKSSAYQKEVKRFKIALGHFITLFVVLSILSILLVIGFATGRRGTRQIRQAATGLSFLYTIISALVQEVIDWMIKWIYPDDPLKQMLISPNKGVLMESINE